jgi:hypothetical protein
LMLRKFKKSDLTTPIWQRLGNGSMMESQSVGNSAVMTVAGATLTGTAGSSTMLPDPFQWLNLASSGPSEATPGSSLSSLSSPNSAASTEHELGPFVTFYELCPSQSFLKSVLRAVCSPPLLVPDSSLKSCMICRDAFSETRWRHHCRLCARLLCHACSSRQAPASAFPSGFDISLHPNDNTILTVTRNSTRNERVCDACYAVLSLRVAKQESSKPTLSPADSNGLASSGSTSATSSTSTSTSPSKLFASPTRRLRRGSAPDGSPVFQSLISPSSPGSELKLGPEVPPPRPPVSFSNVTDFLINCFHLFSSAFPTSVPLATSACQ